MLSRGFHYYVMRGEDDVCTDNSRKLNERSQVHYDYHGGFEKDVDEADCYAYEKAVSLA